MNTSQILETFVEAKFIGQIAGAKSGVKWLSMSLPDDIKPYAPVIMELLNGNLNKAVAVAIANGVDLQGVAGQGLTALEGLVGKLIPTNDPLLASMLQVLFAIEGGKLVSQLPSLTFPVVQPIPPPAPINGPGVTTPITGPLD